MLMLRGVAAAAPADMARLHRSSGKAVKIMLMLIFIEVLLVGLLVGWLLNSLYV